MKFVWRQTGKPFLAALPFALLLFLTSWRFLIFHHRVPLDGNMITLYFPNWVYATKLLSLGHWPLWNPFRDMGEPFWADPQTMAAYPIFWLAAFQRSFWSFLVSWYLIHSVLAAFFFGLLARHYERDWTAAAMAAILGSLNGYFLSHLSPNVFASTAWFPAVLFFAVRGSVWGTGLCLAAQWLAGFPDFSLLTVMVVCVLAVRERRAGIRLVGLSGMLALGLVLYQFLPFLEYFAHAIRPLIVSSEQAIQFSIPPTELLRMLFVPQWTRLYPQLSGDPAIMAFYMGLPALLLSAWAVARGGAQTKRLALGVGVCLLLSMGQYIPGFRSWRFIHVFCYPAHWLLLATAGFVLLSAQGVARIPLAWGRYAALGIVALDLVGFAQVPRVAWIDPEFLTTRPPLADNILKQPYPTRIYHTPIFQKAWQEQEIRTREEFNRFRDFLAPSYGMAFGVADAQSHQVLLLKRTAQFLARLEKEGPASPLLQDAGISTVITLTGRHATIENGTRILTVKPPHAPLALLPDLNDAVFSIQQWNPVYAEVSVETKTAKTLVLNQVAGPGWQVKLDGEPVSLHPYDDTFIAAAVPPGIHRVIFRYHPWTITWGCVGTCLTLAIALFLALA